MALLGDNRGQPQLPESVKMQFSPSMQHFNRNLIGTASFIKPSLLLI
jgi:hypothetical protein